jgi:SAM-dependent methyltransferase
MSTQLPPDEGDPLARLVPFYDLEYGGFTDDLPLYVNFARAGDGTALELGCGTGRVLRALADAGIRAVGIDCSAAMLAHARRRLTAAGLHHVELYQLDMRRFTLGRRFGLVFAALNTFMHLETQADQLAALRTAAGHLTPDGRLVLDLFNPHTCVAPERSGLLMLHCEHRLEDPPRHVLHFECQSIDLATQRIEVTFLYDETFPDGTVRRTAATFPMRYCYLPELELLLAASELALEAAYGSYELDPYSSESDRLIIVARPAHRHTTDIQ